MSPPTLSLFMCCFLSLECYCLPNSLPCPYRNTLYTVLYIPTCSVVTLLILSPLDCNFPQKSCQNSEILSYSSGYLQSLAKCLSHSSTQYIFVELMDIHVSVPFLPPPLFPLSSSINTVAGTNLLKCKTNPSFSPLKTF